MTRRKNHLKDSFIASIPTASFYSDTDLIAKKCKFNFSYMDSNQEAGKNFNDFSAEQICKILDKLKYYGKDSLEYWSNQRVGAGGLKVFSIYGNFPRISDYKHPKHVPHEAKWARFRLEYDMRLIGFVVPDELHNKTCKRTSAMFDSNTFYIVFLDDEHGFYKT